MLASGIIDLLAGAVVLAIGHTLFMDWLNLTAGTPGGSSDEAQALSGDR